MNLYRMLRHVKVGSGIAGAAFGIAAGYSLGDQITDKAEFIGLGKAAVNILTIGATAAITTPVAYVLGDRVPRNAIRLMYGVENTRKFIVDSAHSAVEHIRELRLIKKRVREAANGYQKLEQQVSPELDERERERVAAGTRE